MGIFFEIFWIYSVWKISIFGRFIQMGKKYSFIDIIHDFNPLYKNLVFWIELSQSIQKLINKSFSLKLKMRILFLHEKSLLFFMYYCFIVEKFETTILILNSPLKISSNIQFLIFRIILITFFLSSYFLIQFFIWISWHLTVDGPTNFIDL